MKKAVSIILVLTMIFSVLTIGASAASVKTECGGNCDTCPSIVVPGIGQSNVWALDENGDYILDDEGNRVSCFPAIFDIGYIIKRAIFPVLLTLLTQRDIGLSDALSDVILDSFEVNMCDDNGKNTGNLEVEKYPYSVAECSEYEKQQIYNNVPLLDYAEQAGEDHLYYFAYNSFANHLEIVNELYDFIQMVKRETGHDKVNIVPISMGGSVANGLLEYHPDVMDDLNKVVYIVPALDGSTIIGDVFNGRINFLDPDYLYHGFLENSGLLDKGTSRMIEVLLRIFPDDVLAKALNAGVKTLVEDVMIRSTSMWSLCPSGDYPTAAQKYLSDPEMASIKAQTYKYYQAQLHSDANIQKLLAKGVQIFNVAQYDFRMINVGGTWNTQNADYIIHLDSTSMGAYAANIGETLPTDYVQKNTHCSNPEHNHISPDRVVDASAGLLPDTTFYFDGQRHDLTQHNDVILKIAMELIAHDDIKDVYSSPDFPQFNIGRDVRNLRTLLETAETVNVSALSADEKTEFEAAVAEAENLLNTTVCAAGDFEKAENRLTDILVSIGAMEAEKVTDYTFFEKLSEWLYENYGSNGFSEMPGLSINIVFEAIVRFVNNIFA